MLNEAMVCPSIGVADLSRARGFYEEQLGLKPERELGGMVVVYGAGHGSKLSLYVTPDNAGTNKATYATWEVPDVEVAVTQLRERGVTFEEYDEGDLKTTDGIAAHGDDKAAWFKDPDGNILCLHQEAKA